MQGTRRPIEASRHTASADAGGARIGIIASGISTNIIVAIGLCCLLAQALCEVVVVLRIGVVVVGIWYVMGMNLGWAASLVWVVVIVMVCGGTVRMEAEKVSSGVTRGGLIASSVSALSGWVG